MHFYMDLTLFFFHPVKHFNLLLLFKLPVHSLPVATQIAPTAIRQLIYSPFCTFLPISGFTKPYVSI